MTRRLLIALAAVALSLTAFVGATAGAPVQMFVTPLSAGEEPLEATHASHARGAAIFQLNPAGTQLSYRLIASNVDNVVQAHIHYPGAPGVNGPIIVWLHPSAPPAFQGPTGPQDGVLATGTITASTFALTWPDKSMADLVAALRSGDAYVNVHTNDGVLPTNTGPGDFPGGEIRGQID
jgi:hypothetical protein